MPRCAAALVLGVRVLCPGFRPDNERCFTIKADQDFSIMEPLFEILHLLRGQGAKTVFGESADKERAKHAAITAFNDAVERKPIYEPLIVTDNSRRLLIGINSLDIPSDDLLHFVQAFIVIAADLLLIGGISGFNN